MLYENIFLDSADSAYVSKEISVMSPNQEKDLSAISQHDTCQRRSCCLKKWVASITVRHTNVLIMCPHMVSTTYETQGKGIMDESVCKNKSLFTGCVQKAVGSVLLVSKALLMGPGLLHSSAHCKTDRLGFLEWLALEDLYVKLHAT